MQRRGLTCTQLKSSERALELHVKTTSPAGSGFFMSGPEPSAANIQLAGTSTIAVADDEPEHVPVPLFRVAKSYEHLAFPTRSHNDNEALTPTTPPDLEGRGRAHSFVESSTTVRGALQCLPARPPCSHPCAALRILAA